jgi:hypothetical protein
MNRKGEKDVLANVNLPELIVSSPETGDVERGAGSPGGDCVAMLRLSYPETSKWIYSTVI